MHILIIGAGAVGSFVGARLALAGHDVTLVGRGALVAAVRAGGLTLIEPSGSRQATRVGAVDSLAAAFSDATLAVTYDLALITVKAYDTTSIITELAAATSAPPPLLTLQNGVGNEEALAEAFGAHRIISGAIDTPVSTPAPGQVQAHRARFRAGLAPVGKAAPVIQAAALLHDAGLKIDVFTDYRRLKWTKLLLNVLANAQCAILDWTPAQVMADPVAARLEARAWQEAFAVMAAQGIRPVTLAGYPLPLLAPLVRRISPGLLARGLRRLVSGGRGSKMPSLHIALANGKPSEVNWLNGAVARHGRALGLATPINTALAETLTALTNGREVRAAWRGRPALLVNRPPASQQPTPTPPASM